MGAQDDLVQMQITKYNFTYRTNYTAGSLSGPVVVWLAGNITAQVCGTLYLEGISCYKNMRGVRCYTD